MKSISTATPTELIYHTLTSGHRYRVAKTPSGYLISARSRDQMGLSVALEWLHRTEEAAMACVHAIEAWDAAWQQIQDGQSDCLGEFERLTRIHNEVCARLEDTPLVGQEVKALREATLPDGPHDII